MAKRTKKTPEKAPETFIERKLPETLPELKATTVELSEGATPETHCMVVLREPFRLNGKLYPAGRPVLVPRDASHHMPVKSRL